MQPLKQIHLATGKMWLVHWPPGHFTSTIESLSLINSPLPLEIWANQIFIKISKIKKIAVTGLEKPDSVVWNGRKS